MKVRATSGFRYSGKFYHEGDVLYLEPGPALMRLREGSVEPAIELKPFRPPIASNRVTLWGAYRLHVQGYPPLKPLLNEHDLKPRRLHVRHFAEIPKWLGFPTAPSRRRARPSRRWVTDFVYWDDAPNVRIGPSNDLANSGPSLEERYKNALRAYLIHAAAHFFIERLADGELEAVGVSEIDLSNLKETKIPAGWWRRDIVVDLNRNEIWELMGSKAEKTVRRYSEVQIQTPSASQKRGGQGRRSRKDEMLKAFRELCDNGSLTIEDLKSKKGVRNKVLERLGYSHETPGCSYNTFVEHVGPEIDKLLRTRDSEN